ncbi:Metalloprotease [Frankia sp. AiPs1]|uniref:neutral zinc metallopeptidase n=1 Tax=Frankia sp. AiPa1 TaxID=573492 RepID=UPI00202AE7A4|nr:neutral zinc metallopeptidase [Frankia sp. AiPa1]MCL9762050.1 neutral zinc metallopeptidase [Frankia sp. AiPa1]
MRVFRAAAAAIVIVVGLLTAGCNATDGAALSRAILPAGTSSSQAAGATPTPTPATATATATGCTTSVRSVDDALRVVSEPAGCPGGVNTFWRGELGAAWTIPKIIEYHNGQAPGDACGAQADPDQFSDNALYCTLDDTVAYSVEFMNELAKSGGPTYPLFVLMHELSHRGDKIGRTLGVVPRAEENQADCFAGRQTDAAQTAGLVQMSDAFNGAMLFFSLGDTRGGWFNQEPATAPDAHGSPTQRAQAFAFGYLQDSASCHRIGQSRTGDV